VHRVDALLAALETQVEVGRRIQPAQLSLTTPCDGWTARDVLSHSIGITLKFADFASGVTNRPIAQRGDLVGPDHVTALRSCADAARTAWVSADMTRRCELPFGLFSANRAAGVNLFDVLAHAWDIATATGVELECADVLWSTGLDAARTVIGTSRDRAHYAPEIPVGPEAGVREQFLGFLGRAG
jgi:uncharacterized protein (TIGR03086 family)